MVQSEWPIWLIGGTAVGKFRWYLRLVGLILLGSAASITIGVISGLLSDNGDAGILIATFLFVGSVVGALIHVKRRVARPATLRLDGHSFNVVSESQEIASWSCVDISRVHCDVIARGVGLAAAIPSGFVKIRVNHENDSIVFKMDREAALNCVECLKTLTTNTVYTDPTTGPYTPEDSDRPEQVWRTKLRSEFRSALSEIAFGLFGSAYLCLFVYGILKRQQPQGRVGFLVLMVPVALFGPFLLYSGVRRLFICFSRRKRFAQLSKHGQVEAINDLISQIYGNADSSRNDAR